MKDGICSKCGADEVYVHRNFIRPDNLNGYSEIAIEGYLCGVCGAIEMYIPDTDEARSFIRNWWQPVNPQKRKRKNDESES